MKIFNKRAIKSLFIISLFSLFLVELTVGVLNLRTPSNAFYLFLRINSQLSLWYTFAILVVLIIGFAKMIENLEQNSFKINSINKWFIQKDNLNLLFKILLIILSFVFVHSFRFFTSERYLDFQFVFDIMLVVIFAFTITLFISFFILLVVFQNLVRKVHTDIETMYNDGFISLYSVTFLWSDKLFEQELYVLELNNKIKTFLLQKNTDAENKYISLKSFFLKEIKREKIPPFLNINF